MAALITIEELKEYLKVDGTAKDSFYTGLVNSVSAAIESYLKRSISASGLTKYFDGDGSVLLDLGVRDIVAVTSVEINSVLVDSSYYAVKKDIGIIQMLEGEYSARLRSNTMIFPEGVQNVKVVFTAGFASVPEDIKHACKMLCSYYVNRRGKEDVYSINDTANNTGTTFITKIPADIKMLLNRYKSFKVSAI